MKTLKNGATLVEQKGNTVLARGHRDYITWKITEDGECYWGHYFPIGDDSPQAFKEATESFNERCK